MQIRKMADGKPFRMGKGDTRNVSVQAPPNPKLYDGSRDKPASDNH